jgi:hypothetical protein
LARASALLLMQERRWQSLFAMSRQICPALVTPSAHALAWFQ